MPSVETHCAPPRASSPRRDVRSRPPDPIPRSLASVFGVRVCEEHGVRKPMDSRLRGNDSNCILDRHSREGGDDAIDTDAVVAPNRHSREGGDDAIDTDAVVAPNHHSRVCGNDAIDKAVVAATAVIPAKAGIHTAYPNTHAVAGGCVTSGPASTRRHAHSQPSTHRSASPMNRRVVAPRRLGAQVPAPAACAAGGVEQPEHVAGDVVEPGAARELAARVREHGVRDLDAVRRRRRCRPEHAAVGLCEHEGVAVRLAAHHGAVDPLAVRHGLVKRDDAAVDDDLQRGKVLLQPVHDVVPERRDLAVSPWGSGRTATPCGRG